MQRPPPIDVLKRVASRREAGQAIVFVTLMLPVLLLAGIFLFQAGKLTGEKMRVQNAADAVAFSVSTLEARDLNFMAYTNRAMVANEVGVAQMVGLVSWADNLRSFTTNLAPLEAALNAATKIPYAGPAFVPFYVAVKAIRKSVGTAGKTLWKGLSKFAKVAINALNAVNRNTFGHAQSVYHGATVVLALSTIEPLIEVNAPGAKLSDFGFAALLGHFESYARRFIRTYKPGKVGDEDGFERFATIFRESRDDFTEARSDLILAPFVGPWKGGNELRPVGTSLGDNFNHSAADYTFMLLPVPYPAGTGGADVGDKRMNPAKFIDIIQNEYYGGAVSLNPPMISSRFPAFSTIPGAKYKGLPKYSDTLKPDPTEGAYGFQAPYFLVGIVRDVNPSSGLGSARGEPINNADSLKTTGRLQLLDGAAHEEGADGEVAAIAKSEVYFHRPNDLAFFKREDDKTEYGSTFNPYWQAHLVDPDWLDQSVALVFQQKQPWFPEVSGFAQGVLANPPNLLTGILR